MIHIEMTWRSTALDMDTKVTVLMPEDRHKTVSTNGKKYPVLYILHGMKEDNDSWMNLSNIFLMCRDLDLIVVMPTTYLGFYNDALYGQKYFTYISEELPLKLKNYFPISDKREDTFIMGESMGGYGTARIALAKPQNYSKAVVLSGGNLNPFSFHTTPMMHALYGDEEHWKNSDANLFNLVDKLKTYDGELPEFTFYCGTEDRAYQNATELMNYIKRALPNMKVDGEFWHGEHNFFFWNQAIPKALAKFGYEIPINSVI